MTFQDLHLVEPILRAVEEKGYTHPTPIQEQSIPIVLRGKDLLGCAQTGTGKTAAFTIPILQNLYLHKRETGGSRTIKALVITPTRELAIQIDENMTAYGKYTDLNNTVIFGGVKQHHQVKALKKGIDLLVATPGRLLDLINQGIISLDHIEFFVLDEADQMLDMGFIHDIRKVIAKLPEQRQSLFFSATMTKPIIELSNKILGKPEQVTIKPDQPTAERVEQVVYHVPTKKEKRSLLPHILNTHDGDSVIVFSRTKHGADRIVRNLKKKGFTAAAIHGNKSQPQRQKALKALKEGKLRVLVATDIAARGIDVSQLALVINFDLPNVPETYVHRIGRTGRASASGLAISFCADDEKSNLRDIERLIKQKIQVIADHPFTEIGEVPSDIDLNNKNPRPQEDEAFSKPHKRNPRRKKRPNNKNKDSRNSRNRHTKVEKEEITVDAEGTRSNSNPNRTNERSDNNKRRNNRNNKRRRPNRKKTQTQESNSNSTSQSQKSSRKNNNQSQQGSVNNRNKKRRNQPNNKKKDRYTKIGAPAKVAEPDWDDWG